MCAAEREGLDGGVRDEAMVPQVGGAKRVQEEEGGPHGSERGTLARARVLQQPFEHLWKEEEETASNVVIVDTARGKGVDGCEVVFDVMGSTGVVLQRFASTLSGLTTALKCDLGVQQGPMGVFRGVNVTCHKQEPSKVLFELTAERYNRLGRERDFHFGIRIKSEEQVVYLQTQSVHVLTRQKNCPKSLRRTRCPEYYDFIESVRGNFLLGKLIVLQKPSLTQNIKRGISQTKRAQRPASEEHQPLQLQQDQKTVATKSGALLRPGLMSSPDTDNLLQRQLGTGAPDTRLPSPLYPYLPIAPLRPTRDELSASESSAHLFDEISTLFHHADEEPLTQQQVTSITQTHQSDADQSSRAAEHDSLKRSRSEEAGSPSKKRNPTGPQRDSS